MANRDIYELIARTLQLKNNHKKHAEILQELYEMIDEHNCHVKNMDKKFDNIVNKLEVLLEDGH